MLFASGRIMQIFFTPIAQYDFTAEKPQIKSEMCFLDKHVSDHCLNFNSYRKSAVYPKTTVHRHFSLNLIDLDRTAQKSVRNSSDPLPQ